MATILPHTTRATGTVLTASIYNTDHQIHITNATSLNTELTPFSAATGITVSDGGSNVFGRTITGTAGQITVGNGSGVAGNPTISLPSTAGPSLSDDTAAAGPVVALTRISASPAASDAIGQVQFIGKDSGANDTVYAQIGTTITDPTDGSEDASYTISVMKAGTLTATMVMTAGAPSNVTINGTLTVTG